MRRLTTEEARALEREWGIDDDEWVITFGIPLNAVQAREVAADLVEAADDGRGDGHDVLS